MSAHMRRALHRCFFGDGRQRRIILWIEDKKSDRQSARGAMWRSDETLFGEWMLGGGMRLMLESFCEMLSGQPYAVGGRSAGTFDEVLL